MTIVIGKTATNVPKRQAMDYVMGYTILNDVSSRDLPMGKHNSQGSTISKGLDTFSPCGPFITLKEDVPDPHELVITAVVNGKPWEVQPQHVVPDLHRAEMVAYFSERMTLLPATSSRRGSRPGHDIHRRRHGRNDHRTPRDAAQQGRVDDGAGLPDHSTARAAAGHDVAVGGPTRPKRCLLSNGPERRTTMPARARMLTIGVILLLFAPVAFVQEKGGQEEYGLYRSCPTGRARCPVPRTRAWTWGSTGGIYAGRPTASGWGSADVPLPAEGEPQGFLRRKASSRANLRPTTRDGPTRSSSSIATASWCREYMNSIDPLLAKGGKGPARDRDEPLRSPRQHVWVVLDAGDAVLKFGFDGKLVMTLGEVDSARRGREAASTSRPTSTGCPTGRSSSPTGPVDPDRRVRRRTAIPNGLEER